MKKHEQPKHSLTHKNKKKTIKIADLKKTHEIVDALWFVVDIDYAPRKMPLDLISHDLKNFQNRKKPYSEHSAQNIVDAVLRGEFDLRIFNPIIIRRDQKTQKLYILSGHSRYESFKKLSTKYKDHPMVKKFFKQYGYDFTKIQSLIMDDIGFENAKFIALMSNALATVESDTERAEVYRSFREMEKSHTFVEEFGHKCEKNNRQRIKAYSYLNPDGLPITSIDRFESNHDESHVIKRVAKWIGHLRQKNQDLSDLHENELFDRLFNKWWYGNRKDQINSQSQFEKIMTVHIEYLRATQKLLPNNKLNVLKIQDLSYAMRQYYQLLAEIRDKKKILYTDFHATRRNMNKQIIKKTKQSDIEKLEEILHRLVNIPDSFIAKKEKIEDVLFDIKDYINEDNAKRIRKATLDHINRLEQEYYKMKSKKDRYIKEWKKELTIALSSNRDPANK